MLKWVTCYSQKVIQEATGGKSNKESCLVKGMRNSCKRHNRILDSCIDRDKFVIYVFLFCFFCFILERIACKKRMVVCVSSLILLLLLVFGKVFYSGQPTLSDISNDQLADILVFTKVRCSLTQTMNTSSTNSSTGDYTQNYD